jgi:hypothetical protein
VKPSKCPRGARHADGHGCLGRERDLLAQHGPSTVAQLAARSELALHPEALQRALRACASLGLFHETADGVFSLTPLSQALTRDAPNSVKGIAEMFGASWWRVWAGFAEAVQTGVSQATAQLGMECWEFCNQNPAELLAFGEAMKANSTRSTMGLLAHCDFSSAVGAAVRRRRLAGPLDHPAAGQLRDQHHRGHAGLKRRVRLAVCSRHALRPTPTPADCPVLVAADRVRRRQTIRERRQLDEQRDR